MADSANSTPVPKAHGPVTAAIRAFAAEHDPSHSSVVYLAAERATRGPTFQPIEFSFPLSNTLWTATYLPAVRFAAEFLGLRGKEAIARIGPPGAVDSAVIATTLDTMTTTIDHLEEVVEALRTARSRLHETGCYLGLCSPRGGRS